MTSNRILGLITLVGISAPFACAGDLSRYREFQLGSSLQICNGQLFRMVVDYDPYNTEGATAEDMIESISAKYGPATKPAAEIALPSTYQETAKVWLDGRATLARASGIESLRLEALEASQREVDRKKKDNDNRNQHEKARLMNNAL